ncbi:MAG: type II toxin-antitoxin system VapC family toxin [Candidatus Marsarchaeota archaeon]|jgi:predicted nucleic acid-binding protein|nr:type II toxin-antitoxin system VapC family toxin [Candidatus Marsarchaeota archaeon]MCL5111901.1 type II toxin-antitoxin system VapC family toxin [Candidatus Marsarchaeota archaeon]
MKIFLDSSAIIEFFRNTPKAVDAVNNADEIYTSSICAYEVLLGEIYREEKYGKSHLEKMQRFFETAATLPFTHSDSSRAAGMIVKLSLKGKKVPDFDAMIATQALSNGATVLTKDPKHFNAIKEETGLSVEVVS